MNYDLQLNMNYKFLIKGHSQDIFYMYKQNVIR